MIQYTDVIVDLQAGDTGKGKVAHALAKNYDMVLRYNGGANAGHTVYHDGKKIVTHQVPIGVLFGIPSYIGLGCVVNIQKLVEEIRDLQAQGVYTDGLIFVDKRAHVVFGYHIEEDSRDSRIGTTRQGIGPAYRDKYSRQGTRIGDLNLSSITDFKVCDIYEVLFSGKEKRILCEGAQGFQIDIDWGDYPYVTSSHCTVGSAILNGVPPQKLRHIYGIMKAYETYSGFKTTFQDETDTDLEKIQELGGEFVVKAANINGVTDLIINKADILDKVGVFKYVYRGTTHSVSTLDEFRAQINDILYEATDIEEIIWSMTPNGI